MQAFQIDEGFQTLSYLNRYILYCLNSQWFLQYEWRLRFYEVQESFLLDLRQVAHSSVKSQGFCCFTKKKKRSLGKNKEKKKDIFFAASASPVAITMISCRYCLAYVKKTKVLC
jgi:hypothetical protein